jgi:4-hydroxy-tetrahydrodipicolinate reductase
MIKVGVVGAMGKMGQEVVKAVCEDNELNLVCAIDINNIDELVCSKSEVRIMGDLKAALSMHKPDVVVDFTQPKYVFENAKICLENGVAPVIGTTGLTDEQIEELKTIAKQNGLGCLIAPNFSTGAVLMMKFAQMAAKYFDNAEIIELHHNQKKDAPSGTAIKTALMMSQTGKMSFETGNCPETETITGSRGGKSYSDIRIHSVRMPGYIASQEVIFGSSGQVFKIRHDSMDRQCYMSGVKMAIKYIAQNKDFIYGLENIMS